MIIGVSQARAGWRSWWYATAVIEDDGAVIRRRSFFGFRALARACRWMDAA